METVLIREKNQPFIGEVREIRQGIIFLLIEKDKVRFGRYRIGLAFADTVPLFCSSNPLQSRQSGRASPTPPFAFPSSLPSLFHKCSAVAVKSHSDARTGCGNETFLQVQQCNTVITFLGSSERVGKQLSVWVFLHLKRLNSLRSCQKNHSVVQGISIQFLSSLNPTIGAKYWLQGLVDL